MASESLKQSDTEELVSSELGAGDGDTLCKMVAVGLSLRNGPLWRFHGLPPDG